MSGNEAGKNSEINTNPYQLFSVIITWSIVSITSHNTHKPVPLTTVKADLPSCLHVHKKLNTTWYAVIGK